MAYATTIQKCNRDVHLRICLSNIKLQVGCKTTSMEPTINLLMESESASKLDFK